MAGRIPFAYLEDIHMRFMKNYGKVANTALAYAMNDEFSRVLHQQMEYYSSNPNSDTINRVKGEIAEVSLVTQELCVVLYSLFGWTTLFTSASLFGHALFKFSNLAV